MVALNSRSLSTRTVLYVKSIASESRRRDKSVILITILRRNINCSPTAFHRPLGESSIQLSLFSIAVRGLQREFESMHSFSHYLYPLFQLTAIAFTTSSRNTATITCLFSLSVPLKPILNFFLNPVIDKLLKNQTLQKRICCKIREKIIEKEGSYREERQLQY